MLLLKKVMVNPFDHYQLTVEKAQKPGATYLHVREKISPEFILDLNIYNPPTSHSQLTIEIYEKENAQFFHDTFYFDEKGKLITHTNRCFEGDQKKWSPKKENKKLTALIENSEEIYRLLENISIPEELANHPILTRLKTRSLKEDL